MTLTPATDMYNLGRFVTAQEPIISTVLEELREGQ
jgi:uncharacterized protein (DUF1810 family)